ncbi:MAG: Positive regulator of sigma E, RseC/MucC [Thermotoga sp. 50_1627]|nr:MAG: Positive regulator of sigma E, RseC/MucC [Thermotoga sp. 50_64]KUK25935.1 MAG: Positive regulator of sigma E, RseC/MucC [Thermotoga sp. 50_1627]MDK2923864.1 sigma-E factor negative regulatory protein RseC [Pseudothermotoga sp.]
MVVKTIINNNVVLERDRTSMCGKCPANMLCTGEAQKVRLVVEKDNLDLKEDDVVLVETPAVSATKTAFLVYTIPTVLFVLTVFLTVKIWGELTAFFSGIASVTAYFFFLKLYDKRFRKNFRPRIVEIIEKAGSTDPSDDASLPR